MKTKYSLFIAATVLLFLINCKKESRDFRAKYVGNWYFVTEFRTFDMGDSTLIVDTVRYLGSIYTEGSDAINIHYTDSTSVTLNIDCSGNLSGFPTQYSGGEFSGDSKIHMYLRWGGLGGGTIHAIDGIKN